MRLNPDDNFGADYELVPVMKLLFVHECFGSLGGAESNMFHTATELKRRGHTVGIVHGPSTGKGEPQWQNLFEERFALGGRDSVKSAIDRFQPDSTYVHKMSDVGVLTTLEKSGRRVVRMVHDHESYCLRGCRYGHFSRQICTRSLSAFCVFPCGGCIGRNAGAGFPLKWVSYLNRKQELKLNRGFDRLIVATNYMKEELLRNDFDGENIEIHAPVPPRAKVVPKKLTDETDLLIYSGQIIRGKGVDVLLRALKHVRSDFQCLILGDGDHRAHCEALSRELGLSDRVHFEGYVSQDKLQSYYGRANVMVMSSVWPEPFGAVGLEGMHHALPVVAFDAGGIKEWLIDGLNGFLVPWMDVRSYAARVEQLLADRSLARRMGECGRQMVNEKFDFSGYMDGLENMFGRVIRGPTS